MYFIVLSCSLLIRDMRFVDIFSIFFKRDFTRLIVLLMTTFTIVSYTHNLYASSIFDSNISSSSIGGDRSSFTVRERDYNDDNYGDSSGSDGEKNYVHETSKNYVELGAEEYNQRSEWEKYNLGIDVNLFIFSINNSNLTNSFNGNDFFSRFQNLGIFFGKRYTRFFGTECGYTFFGRVIDKNDSRGIQHNIFASGVIYTPMLDLRYTTIEGYVSLGGAVMSNFKNNVSFGAKFGAGAIFSIYGSLAMSIGADYYFPFKSFSDKGFLILKTGLSVYFG